LCRSRRMCLWTFWFCVSLITVCRLRILGFFLVLKSSRFNWFWGLSIVELRNWAAAPKTGARRRHLCCLRGRSYLHHTSTTRDTHPPTHTTPLHLTTLQLSSVRAVPLALKKKMRWMCTRFLFVHACVYVCERGCDSAHQCVCA